MGSKGSGKALEMVKRKLRIMLEFDFSLEPREGVNPENDSYIQGMVAAQLQHSKLKELQNDFRNALEDGLAEMEWDCEADQTRMTITVDPILNMLKGKKGKGKNEGSN